MTNHRFWSDPDDLPPDCFDRDVERKLYWLKVQEEAKRQLKAFTQGPAPQPSPVLLADLLGERDQPTRYRIEGLLPVDGRVMVAAQYKSGKTTLVGNLIRALADGTPFLDHFTVNRPDGLLALVDTEMSRGTLRSWLRDRGSRTGTGSWWRRCAACWVLAT